MVDIVAIEIARHIKVRRVDKSQYARDAVDRKLRRIRPTNNAVSERLNRQISVSCRDRRDGGCILRNADARRRRTTVAGDDRRVVVDRRDRKIHEHAAVRTDSIIDGEREAVRIGFRSIMIVSDQPRIDIGLSKRIADGQRHTIQSQDPIHRNRVQCINQFRRSVVNVRGQQSIRRDNIPDGVLRKRLPKPRHKDLFVIDIAESHRNADRAIR